MKHMCVKKAFQEDKICLRDRFPKIRGRFVSSRTVDYEIKRMVFRFLPE